MEMQSYPASIIHVMKDEGETKKRWFLEFQGGVSSTGEIEYIVH